LQWMHTSLLCGHWLILFIFSLLRASMLARQALYHMNHISRPFHFSYFSDRVSPFCTP
jgi:hypothetical protein